MWGTVTIGGIAFREETAVASDGMTLSIRGQESTPPSLLAAVRAAHDNVLGLLGQDVPVVFSDKTMLTGFYRVTDASSNLVDKHNGGVVTTTWTMQLERLGTERDVEFESWVPTIGRLDELAGTQTPNLWHAPPVGVTSYYTGSTVPAGSVERVSEDGSLTVHTGIPQAFPPRWTVGAADYLRGSARVVLDSIRRVGLHTAPQTTWEISNGLVRVQPSGAGLEVAVWGGSAWESAKSYLPAVSGTNLAVVPEFTILRNDPEEVAVRLSYATNPGRVTVDLALRRGSRFVTGVMKRHSAATLGIRRTAAEAATLATGGMHATAVDADGNRFVMLSSRLLGTTDVGTAYISKAGLTVFDFAVGHEVGASPASGDAFADLLAQYLGTAVPTTRAMRR